MLVTFTRANCFCSKLSGQAKIIFLEICIFPCLKINICSQSIINISHSVPQTVVFVMYLSLPCSYCIFLDVDVTGNVRFLVRARSVLFKFSFPCFDRNRAGLRSLSMRFCVCSISGELNVPIN